ncbi:MAG: coiled coil domain-containing protein [Methylovulum sp.]|nr:coiled coil domain-containing protein [Methylovulum sp.]
MKTKEEYIDNLAAELKAWSTQIDHLAAKAEQSAGMAKRKYNEEINVLHANQQAASAKMRELEDASDDAWESVKETADQVWNDLRTGVARAVAKFN